MGLVTNLNGMHPQMENLGLPGTWFLLYFGFMGLFCVLTGGCIIFLHWRKKLQQERCAQHWMEVMNASSFTNSPLLYWINTQRRHGINTAIRIGPPSAGTNTDIKVKIPDCLWESDTPKGRAYGLRGSNPRAATPVAMQAALVVSEQLLSNQLPQCQIRSPFPIPIFQEMPFVPPLHKMPPMLERSASYPLDINLERNVH
ncbi:Testis-expressed sequence 38 protein [Sciurus carolinensis]|uniref:Testis-expressed sequence 38 protein n=3 Tax=Sciurus carolinensis TaxID=30640 RepID=A0AA41MVH9_SCICA|nr:Testis-expressed sequence 38 protein [Sciurus carolinensis]